MASPSKWSVGQLVNVKPRTWAGINRPGGVGKITTLHYSSGFVESMDVKYIVGSGSDAKLDLDFVEAYEPLETKGRSRRGRDLYSASPAKRAVSQDGHASDQPAKKKSKTTANKKPASNTADENDDPKKTKTVHRKIKAKKTVRKTPAAKKAKLPPPATHVIVKKRDNVSPLRDTPLELRAHKKKSSKSKASPSKEASSKSRTSKKPAAATTKPIATTASGQRQEFVIRKAPRPKEPLTKMKPVSLAAKCGEMIPKVEQTTKRPSSQKEQARPLPLQRVYDSEMHRANDFVEELVGKPEATALSENDDKSPVAECTVTLTPPNTERINLFVTKISEIFADDDEGVDKEDLLQKINKRLKTDGAAEFDIGEMEDCLSSLINDGKVMVSDGVVYSF